MTPKLSTILIMDAISSIPRGRTASYGMVAAMAGFPRGARQVVRVLSSMSRAYELPWWRVVRKDGRIALAEGSGRELQAELLRAEGVEVAEDGWVDMGRYGLD